MVFVLLAWPRSGTNLLCQNLNTHPHVKALFEIFHPSLLQDEGNFYGFIKKTGVFEDVLPNKDLIMFNKYLIKMKENYADKKVILDVKYWSTHHINGEFFHPSARPVFFSEVLPKTSGVLHLIRKNALRVFVSLKLGEMRGQFHSKVPLERQKVSIDPAGVVHYVKTLIMDRENVSEWLKLANVPVLEIDYDTLVGGDNGALSGAVMSEIADFLGVEPRFNLAPKLVKTTSDDLREVLGNYDDVCEAVIKAGFGELID